MGLRWHFGTLLVCLLLCTCVTIRGTNGATLSKGQMHGDTTNSASSPSEVKVSYKPPLLAAPPAPRAVSYISTQNGYQPPLILASSNDYKPLISSSQTQSVRYQPPDNIQGFPQGLNYPQLAPIVPSAQTAVSSLPIQQGSRQGFSYTGDALGPNSINNQLPSQPLQSAPSSAVASDSVPKEDDGKNDEYVVYYYYYYDNDNHTANNSLNFDDIPSLESYDSEKSGKEPEKSASARTLAADINSLSPHDSRRLTDNGDASQPRSVPSGNQIQPPFIRSDKPDDTTVQALKPVSNVFRYGGNEVPRFPILPNFVVSDAPTSTKPSSASNLSPSDIPTEPASSGNGAQSLSGSDGESDEVNNVVDRPLEPKEDEKIAQDEPTTTPTTTEPTTTTEITTTTTTEKSRRRPGPASRRRFNSSPTFSSNRRQPPSRSTAGATSTTTTTTVSPASTSTRGSFRGSSRARPRPSFGGGGRARPGAGRNAGSSTTNDITTKPPAEVTSSSSATTTAKSRFGSSPSRRFSSTRNRPAGSTPRPNIVSSASPVRSRPTSRPRPNPVSRNRPPRPGLFRSRTATTPEEPETTTPTPEPPPEEESSPSLSENEQSPPDDNEDKEEAEEEETSDIEEEVPTTTEKSRFSALFRPRNRGTLNRPRPVVRS